MLAGARLGMNLPPVDDGITCSETVREGQVRERERGGGGGGGGRALGRPKKKEVKKRVPTQ
jgi:hypothetical protein